ncbi:MAG: response regulator [Candidatus Omnitrophica bacterium]|nr:response regulator [Candidatus Omnitrophota bacterium]
MAKKVLYIEDSPTDAVLIKELLEKAGLDVTIAKTGKEGIEKAKEIKPDLVLLDCILPDISGFDVCSKIRKDGSLHKTLIIMITIKDSLDEISKAFILGADDYVIKPSMPEFLVRKIKLYLNEKR